VSEGRPERVGENAAEFTRQKVDVIVTGRGAVATLMDVEFTLARRYRTSNLGMQYR
jgi:hypothetical protein